MADLRTTYLGLELDNPIVVAASGITSSVEGVRRCADSGAGAVVLKSLFEELIVQQSASLEKGLDASTHPEALDYLRADLGWRLGPLPYLDLVEQAREAVDVPVIASVHCASSDGWVPFAKRIESAGAAALELNLSHFPRAGRDSSHDIEKRYADVVAAVAQSLDLPVSVKIGPHFTCLWNVLSNLVEAGARGLVLFNRYYAVDVDLDDRRFIATVGLSSPSEIVHSLRWIGLAAADLDCDLAASTGVHDAAAILKAILAGATVAQVCSILYRHGPEHLAVLREHLATWLDDEGFAGVDDVRGLAQKPDAEASLLSRLQYVEALEHASDFYRF